MEQNCSLFELCALHFVFFLQPFSKHNRGFFWSEGVFNLGIRSKLLNSCVVFPILCLEWPNEYDAELGMP